MKPATAFLLALCLSTVCATLPLAVLGMPLTPEVAWLSLAAGIVGAAIYWWKAPASRPLKMSCPEWFAVFLFAMFALRAFCWLVFTDGDSIRVLSRNNLGDLPLHLTYIRYLARGPKFWPENPIYSGLPLHYPAGIDIFNAMLSLAGCDDIRALIWVGLIASAVTCYALLRWGRWFAVAGFLCNGGFAGWKFFHHFKYQLQDYQQDVAWKSIPLSMFVTQRGLLYAIPAGLLLLAAWRAQWFPPPGENEAATRLPQWVQVALYATMPLFHLHTFLFLSALLGFWFAIGDKRLRHEVIDLVLWSVLPATACVALVAGLFQRGQSTVHIIHLFPGWMQDGEVFLKFWVVNFGILPFLVLILLILACARLPKNPTAPLPGKAGKGGPPGKRLRYTISPRDIACTTLAVILLGSSVCAVIFLPWHVSAPVLAENLLTAAIPLAALALLAWARRHLPENPAAPAAFAFVAPSLIVFIIACFVMFAPWEWDNMKLMIWSYLAVLPFLHEMLLSIPERSLPSVRISAYIVLFFSGFISMLGGMHGPGLEIAKRSELDPVNFAVSHLPPDATFAAWPTYNHPLLLCGCKVVEGYDGHLFSHGIDYQPRLDQLKALMNGDPGWRQIATALHVRYLYWGYREDAAYPNSTQPWKDLPVTATGDWGTLYDIGEETPGGITNLHGD
jgi:hypothetical protein